MYNCEHSHTSTAGRRSISQLCAFVQVTVECTATALSKCAQETCRCSPLHLKDGPNQLEGYADNYHTSVRVWSLRCRLQLRSPEKHRCSLMHLMQQNQSFYSSNNSRGIGSLHSFALHILFICACAHYFVRWTHFSLSSSSSDFSWLSASCLMACSAEETWHCARLRVLCRPWLCRNDKVYACMLASVCLRVCVHMHVCVCLHASVCTPAHLTDQLQTLS